VPIVVVLVGIGAYFYSDTIINFPNNVPEIIDEITLITQTPEPITKTILEPISKALEIKPTNMTAIAFYIHDLINEERRSNGLAPLSWNPKLTQAALNHSNDMAKRDYFQHDSPEGHDFSYRYSQVGFSCETPISQYTYSGGGENIMFLEGYYGEENITRQSVEGWMNSAGHRQNILTPYFLSEGIGVAESSDGKIYATQDFC